MLLQPQFIPAYVNYANFLQQQNREKEAFDLLQQGLKVNPDAALYHSLGLWFVRSKQMDKGLKSLKTAAELEPDTVSYQYVYAVAISEKQPKEAIKILENALQKHTGNLDILMALSSYYQKVGDEKRSTQYRKKVDQVLSYNP